MVPNRLWEQMTGRCSWSSSGRAFTRTIPSGRTPQDRHGPKARRSAGLSNTKQACTEPPAGVKEPFPLLSPAKSIEPTGTQDVAFALHPVSPEDTSPRPCRPAGPVLRNRYRRPFGKPPTRGSPAGSVRWGEDRPRELLTATDEGGIGSCFARLVAGGYPCPDLCRGSKSP